MDITTVIFDLDGTLVQHSHALLPPIFTRWGHPRTSAEIDNVVKAEIEWVYAETIQAGTWTAEIDREWNSRILRGLEIADPDDIMLERVLDFFRSDPVPPLFEDVANLLKQLSAEGYQLGIITQRGRKGTETFLTKYDILGQFGAIICGNDGHGRKPTAGPFLAALGELDCQPSQAVFIGDRIDDDCEGAINAGLGAFLIDRHEQFRDEVEEHHRITHLSSLSQLLQYL